MDMEIAERLLKTVEEYNFEVKDNRSFDTKDQILKLTVSIGVAEFPKDAGTENDIITIADRMMYEAKKKGRGQVYRA